MCCGGGGSTGCDGSRLSAIGTGHTELCTENFRRPGRCRIRRRPSCGLFVCPCDAYANRCDGDARAPLHRCYCCTPAATKTHAFGHMLGVHVQGRMKTSWYGFFRTSCGVDGASSPVAYHHFLHPSCPWLSAIWGCASCVTQHHRSLSMLLRSKFS